MKVTPILFVEEIEQVLPFWVQRLGFQSVVEVPEGDRIGFILLARDGAEVMYQSRASIMSDVPALAEGSMAPSGALYIDVDSIDDIIERLDDVDILIPKRTTFYGATEIFVRAPGGHIVGFAQQGEEK
jgi:hypothetical protein